MFYTSFTKGDLWWEDLVCVRNVMAMTLSFLSRMHIESLSKVVLEQSVKKDCWTPLLFFFIHKQTKLWLCYPIQPSLSHFVYQGLCYNVFSLSDDDKGMVCDLCKGYLFFLFLISHMSSPYINLNKFLRICWCMLISAWDGGCISALWICTKRWIKTCWTHNCRSSFCIALSGEIAAVYVVMKREVSI